ncbi:NACHT domain-containing protein [Streptomyces sp. NPDC005209]|uniref:NACHT domain-containing protein n=1 Tax=Streptomyces sp. NPDC005209 TaxID=3156715 RepID=UPI0033B203C6
MRWWRYGIWLGAVAVTGGVLLVALRTGKLNDPATLTAVLGLGVSVTGLAVTLWHSSSDAEKSAEGAWSQERLERLAGRLAAAVREQWQAEWRLRRLQDPYPFHVHWSLAEAWLGDAPEGGGVPVEPSEGPEGISSAFDMLPSRRLVVLGEPGSGKTVLAVRFVLERLADRAAGDRVPVVFPLSGWQPEQERLRDWMAAHLRATYPGAPWTKRLLAAGLVLPVLDGLDEMPQSSWGMALHRLNAELDAGEPVLLTCRTAAYTKAVETGDVLTAASVVELQPLTFEAASAYLTRTARPMRGTGGQRTTLWDPVLSHLRAHSHAPASQALRQALGTPLMVAMVRAVYNETGNDPAELLQDRFDDPAVLERHLLEAYVPAAFADSPHTEQAHRWLRYLATHMQRQTTRQLAWWKLRHELPWPLRRLGPVLLLGGLAVITVWVSARTSPWPVTLGSYVAGVCLGYLVLSHGRRVSTPGHILDPRHVPRVAALLAVITAVAGILYGCVRGITWLALALPASGVARWLYPAVGGIPLGLAAAAALAVLGILGEPMPLYVSLGRWRLASSTAIVLLTGAVTYLVAASFSSSHRWQEVVLAVVIAGLVAVGLHNRPDSTAQTVPAGSTRQVHRRRRRRLLWQGLVVGLLTGMSFGVAYGLSSATPLAVRAALREDFPQGHVRHLADGTRYTTTSDGWIEGLRPNGDRYLQPPGPVDGVVEQDPDGTRSALAAASTAEAAHWHCPPRARCTAFHGRIQLCVRAVGDHHLEVRLPNGTYVEDSGFRDKRPYPTLTWLLAAPPGALFSTMMRWSLALGLALGLVAGLAAGVHAWLVSPADTAQAVSPRASLRTDRATVITRGVTLVAFGTIGKILALFLPATPTWKTALLVGSYVPWLLVGPLAVFLSAWGWFLITRLWLCGTRQLPWRLMAFLEEAHHRGVLRQTGATYEFRHARVQEQLATTPGQGTPSPGSPSVV